jgi:NAD(P)-dependent dehydrogenase (short-subunit alcohol dehydrogenase family)
MSEQVEATVGDGSRAALVTGAASGIGRATALRFGSKGLRVGCFDLDKTGVEETAAAVRDAGGEAVAFDGDVCDEMTTKAVVAGVVDAFGSLDVLANVAGIGHFRHSEDEAQADWSRIVGVNLTGTFLMCRDAMPALVASHGVIVNVASIAGLTGHAYGAAYSASKGGVVSLTKTLAVEFASRDVRVNAVCPGGVMTPIINSFMPPEDAEASLVERIAPLMGRFIEPDEIATAIEFLASQDMPNLTGAVLVVDGATVT